LYDLIPSIQVTRPAMYVFINQNNNIQGVEFKIVIYFLVTKTYLNFTLKSPFPLPSHFATYLNGAYVFYKVS